jgi:DNA-binding MarR family transcriptional regulator
MSNASRLVEKLKLKALIDRRECPADRRQVDVTITEKGLALLTILEDAISQSNKEIISLSEEEVETLNQLLDKLREE